MSHSLLRFFVLTIVVGSLFGCGSPAAQKTSDPEKIESERKKQVEISKREMGS